MISAIQYAICRVGLIALNEFNKKQQEQQRLASSYAKDNAQSTQSQRDTYEDWQRRRQTPGSYDRTWYAGETPNSWYQK